jgi:hypothetical protein
MFLDDWAKRGRDDRIGLLNTCTISGCVPTGYVECPTGVDCRFVKDRIQAVAVFMLTAFILDIFGLLFSIPFLLGRWITWFGISIAGITGGLYFIAMCIFLSVRRNYFDLSQTISYELSSGFGLCVVSWMLSIVVAIVAFLAWRWQAKKLTNGKFCKFLC